MVKPAPTAAVNMWSEKSSCKSQGFLPGREYLGPLFLLLGPPVAIVLLVTTNTEFQGSFAGLARHFYTSPDRFYVTLYNLWPSVRDPVAWKLFGAFCAFELMLMRVLPGKLTQGPVTPGGNIPEYKANGELAYYITVVTFLALLFTGILPPALIFDKLGSLLAVQILSSVSLCWVLYLKGRFYPSTSDNGHSGNIIFDYYWGTELYPRILGWDVKLFTNCRFGMMLWGILPLAYAAKQWSMNGTIADSMLVSVLLQVVYVCKFFHWEMGYMKSIDIMHDRGGFYLVFGCMSWVPGLYTSHTAFLVHNAVEFGLPLAAFITLLGLLSIYINYDCDRQREHFRKHPTDTVWGKAPEYITATYKADDGKERTSLLLLSGYWGMSRHFHYLPELTAAFLWSVPGGLATGCMLPWSYFLFLSLLLTDRAYRDEVRCEHKYGVHWHKYVERVPHRMIPGAF